MSENVGQSSPTRVPTNRLSLRIPLWIAGGSASACALIWTGWGIYLYWNDVRIVNFLAAWIPFALSLLLAFVPDQTMKKAKKIWWRSSVIVLGLSWSVVLWHQQVVTDAATRKDQESMLMAAVAKANEHSDKKIELVQTDVQGVKKDVGGVKSDLKDTRETISGMVSKSESDITSRLSKVGKPDPPELTTIVFSFWEDHPLTPPPFVTKSIAPDLNGDFTTEVTFFNSSSTPANNMDVWIQVCDGCEFAEEPLGFEQLKGQDKHTRHKMVTLLNPRVSMEKITLKIKPQKEISMFNIALRYACSTCGKLAGNQLLTVFQSNALLGSGP